MKKSTKAVHLNLHLEPYVELEKLAQSHHIRVTQMLNLILAEYIKKHRID